MGITVWQTRPSTPAPTSPPNQNCFIIVAQRIVSMTNRFLPNEIVMVHQLMAVNYVRRLEAQKWVIDKAKRKQFSRVILPTWRPSHRGLASGGAQIVSHQMPAPIDP